MRTQNTRDIDWRRHGFDEARDRVRHERHVRVAVRILKSSSGCPCLAKHGIDEAQRMAEVDPRCPIPLLVAPELSCEVSLRVKEVWVMNEQRLSAWGMAQGKGAQSPDEIGPK